MSASKRCSTLMDISPNKTESSCKKARNNHNLKQVVADINQENYSFLFDNENCFDLNGNEDNLLVKTDNQQIPQDLDAAFNLTVWKRCVVNGVIRDAKTYDLILQLSEKSNLDAKGVCRLQGPWAHTKVESNDVVSVRAVWCDILKCFTVNRDEGTFVTNSDHLISGTSVVGSLFCPRKSVLQDKFRGIDADNKIMTIGSIVHELFQTVLGQKLTTTEEIQRASRALLNSRNMMFMLYGSKMTVQEAQTELQKFITNIANFVAHYIVGDGTQSMVKGDFIDNIDSIQDIEENIWVPQLGLKGRIDVSVTVRRRNSLLNAGQKYIPLELKTGRASFSDEHKGQLIIYQMMLKEIGKQVDSGLLLYLREGTMKEIQATKNEQRDIILLRNELSYYLTRDIKTEDLKSLEELLKKIKLLQLPEPINHRSACSNCGYNTICSVYLSQDNSNPLSSNNPLQRVSQECMAHLKPCDIDYFIHWCGLLALEDQETKKLTQMKSLWSKPREQRRDQGHAIINLKAVGPIIFSDGKYINAFEAADADCLSQSGNIHDFTLTGIHPGDYVIVSTTNRIAVAAGHVYDLKKNEISVRLERNLFDNYQNDNFTIDKHSSQSTNIFNYTNLGVLLEDREESNRLRKIVVERVKPTFSKVLPRIIAKEGTTILAELNPVQRKAVLKALTANEYILLKGLPGTGKTQTLIAIIRLLNLMKKSVIVTSHTHSAVDNVLQRLKPHNIKFLRLGSDGRIASSLHEYGESLLTSTCSNVDELARLYSSYNVIGLTCFAAAHSIFLHRKFDVCIVDEATQVFQPTILRPLFYANKFILVGDPDQLQPVVKSKIGRNIGASESLFERLDHPEARAVLTIQYRMNKVITKLANELTYKGSLTCANETVLNGKINLSKKGKLHSQYQNQKWLIRSLENHIDQSVIFIDTENCLERTVNFEKSLSIGQTQIVEKIFTDETDSSRTSRQKSYTNFCDAAIAFAIVKGLITGGYDSNNIGIIAPYRAQVELLQKISSDLQHFYSTNSTRERINIEGLEVNTVDQYQGRDKEIIIFSCTRTGSLDNIKRSRDAEILEDRRRLTVAITRSKFKLIIIGDEQCLKAYTPFRDILEKIPSRCKISLENGKLGFSWNDILSDLEKVLVEKYK